MKAPWFEAKGARTAMSAQKHVLAKRTELPTGCEPADSAVRAPSFAQRFLNHGFKSAPGEEQKVHL